MELVAEHKRETPEARHDPEREAKLAECGGRGQGLGLGHARRILKEVLTLSRRSQEATLGERNTPGPAASAIRGSASTARSPRASSSPIAARPRSTSSDRPAHEVIDALGEGASTALLRSNTIIGSISG